MPLKPDATAFGRDVIEPGAETWNAAGTVPRDFFEQAGERGLCGLLVPESLGGAGLSMSAFCATLEQLAGHCLSSTFALIVHNNLANAIARFGSDEQRDRYLAPMLGGECIGAFLLTEPGAGSDAGAIQTSAATSTSGWTLNGTKAWVSNAQQADLLAVYAQVADGERTGIASFLVERSARGLTVGPAYALFGGHALGAASVQLNECVVGPDSVMAQPGDGLRAALGGIDIARIAVAAMCCGIISRSLAEAIRYTQTREAFGRTIDNFQGLQWKLADCATDLEAARALTRSAAEEYEHNGATALAAAHAKKFAANAAFTRVADCMQIAGADGLRRTQPYARHLEAAKIAQYIDGTSEIQNIVISRHLASSYTQSA